MLKLIEEIATNKKLSLEANFTVYKFVKKSVNLFDQDNGS